MSNFQSINNFSDTLTCYLRKYENGIIQNDFMLDDYSLVLNCLNILNFYESVQFTNLSYLMPLVLNTITLCSFEIRKITNIKSSQMASFPSNESS